MSHFSERYERNKKATVVSSGAMLVDAITRKYKPGAQEKPICGQELEQ
jgi:hypothetical protein